MIDQLLQLLEQKIESLIDLVEALKQEKTDLFVKLQMQEEKLDNLSKDLASLKSERERFRRRFVNKHKYYNPEDLCLVDMVIYDSTMNMYRQMPRGDEWFLNCLANAFKFIPARELDEIFESCVYMRVESGWVGGHHLAREWVDSRFNKLKGKNLIIIYTDGHSTEEVINIILHETAHAVLGRTGPLKDWKDIEAEFKYDEKGTNRLVTKWLTDFMKFHPLDPLARSVMREWMNMNKRRS